MRRVFRPQALRPRLAFLMPRGFPDPRTVHGQRKREETARELRAPGRGVQPEDQSVNALKRRNPMGALA